MRNFIQKNRKQSQKSDTFKMGGYEKNRIANWQKQSWSFFSGKMTHMALIFNKTASFFIFGWKMSFFEKSKMKVWKFFIFTEFDAMDSRNILSKFWLISVIILKEKNTNGNPVERVGKPVFHSSNSKVESGWNSYPDKKYHNTELSVEFGM